ncbi:MAG: hypothetical protein MR965_04305, partial [Lachnospiraceae bacterium]|nr:hypothetical protein [Lachnospiraceae bacterium]
LCLEIALSLPASLLICGNFQITAFRVHSSLEAKNHIENRATSETVWAQFIFWCAKFELLRKTTKGF